MRIRPFENVFREEENPGDQDFLLFPQCFLAFQKEIAPYKLERNGHLQMLSIWTRPNVIIWLRANISMLIDIKNKPGTGTHIGQQAFGTS